MEIEKGKTIKYIKEQRSVSSKAKEQWRNFAKMKKTLLHALKGSEKSIPQLADELNLPKQEVMYYLMSLLKYGYVITGEIDDMDEYFTYKIRENG